MNVDPCYQLVININCICIERDRQAKSHQTNYEIFFLSVLMLYFSAIFKSRCAVKKENLNA